MIINSLLDTDLYKLTMMQIVFHHFPDALVEYQLKCRTPNVDLLPYVNDIRKELIHLCTLRFMPEDLAYLKSLNFFQDDFLQLLRNFKLDEKYITYNETQGFELTIKGPWLQTILFEVPLLTIISEIYSQNQYVGCDYSIGLEKLWEKINLIKNNQLLKNFSIIDFGTRRRFAFKWQGEVLATLAKELPDNFCGTSNVYFAKNLHIKPAGTMGHEYIQGCQALSPNLRESQKYALTLWLKEYGKFLSIALSDTYNLTVFLQDFDADLCRLFDGVRQDSGDPFICGERILNHYKNMGIDPRSKKIVFSDGLTFPLAIKLYNYFKEATNPVFGIGGNLTNDLGYAPLQAVIKMTECNGQPVAKISDTPDKVTCKDFTYLAYLKKVFGMGS